MTIQYELYLGHESKLGLVSRGEMSKFIANHVAPAFDSFTRIDARGYWKGKSEQSTVIRVLSDNPNDASYALKLIGETYKTRFVQDAVYLTALEIKGELF